MKYPTIDIWKSLYDAADRFYIEAPWKIMENEWIFGVENPITKQIGWCSVMGNASMEYGLCVNRGARGFKALTCMLNEVEPEEMMPYLDSLNMTFEHSDFLESKDLTVIKDLGISGKYKETQKWPRFRAYLPARYPWQPDYDEAVFLRDAIEQAIEVACIARRDLNVLVQGSPDRFLVRTKTDSSGNAEWKNEYKTAELYKMPKRENYEIEPAIAHKIRTHPVNKEMQIEADLFITNTPICDSEPPWLPWLMLAVEVKRDYIFPPDHMAKDVDPVIKGASNLIDILKNMNHRPQRIRVKNELFFQSIKRICDDLGIRLEKVKSLPALQKVKESLKDYMRWDRMVLEK